MARGSVAEVSIDVGTVIYRARSIGAQGFLLVHNHPSGDPTPSSADIKVTQRLRRISSELDVPLLDHFIVAGTRMEAVGH